MEFSPAMRFAALSLIGLFVAGLLWQGFGIYQEDQRAKQAAALAESAAMKPAAPAAGPDQAQASGPDPAPSPAQAREPAQPPAPKLVVHVEGAVQRPGVYTFEQGARVNDAIVAAGGALPDGVPGALNLAAPLTDGAKVFVYTRAEIQPAAAPAQVTAREATYSPVRSSAEAAPAPVSGPKQAVSVNVNTASAAELEAVPGIGPTMARAIVEQRAKKGPFKKLEELTSVSGIGPKTLEKLRPYLKV